MRVLERACWRRCGVELQVAAQGAAVTVDMCALELAYRCRCRMLLLLEVASCCWCRVLQGAVRVAAGCCCSSGACALELG